MYMYTLITPIDRSRFQKPNKICFTIFEHLQDFILIKQNWLSNKNIKLFLILYEKRESELVQCSPHGRGPRRGAHARAGVLAEKPPTLSAINVTTMRPIHLVSDYARRPSKRHIFASGRSPKPSRSSTRRWSAWSRYAGQLGPTQTQLGGRCSPMDRRTTLGSGQKTGGKVGQLLHIGGQPAVATTTFQ